MFNVTMDCCYCCPHGLLLLSPWTATAVPMDRYCCPPWTATDVPMDRFRCPHGPLQMSPWTASDVPMDRFRCPHGLVILYTKDCCTMDWGVWCLVVWGPVVWCPVVWCPVVSLPWTLTV